MEDVHLDNTHIWLTKFHVQLKLKNFIPNPFQDHYHISVIYN